MPRRTLALAAANLLAAVVVLLPWLPERAHRMRIAEGPAAVEAPDLAILPALASFAATMERPLFSPSRRPPTAPAPSGAGPLAARYRLQGLVIAGHARRALIADVGGTRRFELGEGDAIEGWVVKRIDRDAVVFASPAGEATLTLSHAAGAAPPAKP
jgi:hypothetical protein